MINQQIFLTLAEETEKGGLFDIGATLPLVAIQFLLLMFILNIILYNPILTVVDERNEYVLDNLNKASEMTLTAKELNVKYESELILTKKEAKVEITELQKMQQEKFNSELKISQKNIEILVQTVLESFNNKKFITLNNLENDIEILSNQILKKLLIK
jgi:F-type H+-transporting ATPase subunit b